MRSAVSLSFVITCSVLLPIVDTNGVHCRQTVGDDCSVNEALILSEIAAESCDAFDVTD